MMSVCYVCYVYRSVLYPISYSNHYYYYFFIFISISFIVQPLFLQRNLSYLNGRSTKRRTITKRQKKKPFNWDAFLQGLKPVKNNELSHNFLTIKFLGYFDQHVTDDSTNAATIDIFLQSQSSNQSKSLVIFNIFMLIPFICCSNRQCSFFIFGLSSNPFQWKLIQVQ